MSNTDYIYLASPFNHPDEEVRIQRMEAVTKLGFNLTVAGCNVFCPITQSFNLQNIPLASPIEDEIIYKSREPKLTHEDWMRVDIAFLSKAKVLVVYKLPGWDVSKGVDEEITYAEKYNIPIVAVYPNDFLSNILKELNEIFGYEIDKALKEGMEKYKNALHELAIEDTDTIKEKAEKPSILNFPWDAFDRSYAQTPTIGNYMSSLIDHVLRKDYETLVESQILNGGLEDLLIGKQDPADTMVEVNKVFEMGAKKHGLRGHLDYTKDDLELLTNALGRHILKGVENIDEESGLKHRYHALANIMMMKQVLYRFYIGFI